MDTVMSEEKLREVFDHTARKVTADAAGIQLKTRDAAQEKDLYTVHISFKKGFRSSVSLRVDGAMLTRLSRSILEKEDVTPREQEDVAKEYLNVLCGHIAKVLYHATRVASRFNVPSFHQGDYSPEGQRDQFILSYTGDQNEVVQLVHLVPVRSDENGEAP